MKNGSCFGRSILVFFCDYYSSAVHCYGPALLSIVRLFVLAKGKGLLLCNPSEPGIVIVSAGTNEKKQSPTVRRSAGGDYDWLRRSAVVNGFPVLFFISFRRLGSRSLLSRLEWLIHHWPLSLQSKDSYSWNSKHQRPVEVDSTTHDWQEHEPVFLINGPHWLSCGNVIYVRIVYIRYMAQPNIRKLLSLSSLCYSYF